MSSTSIIIASILLIAAVSISVSAPVAKTVTTQTVTYAQFVALQMYWTRAQVTQYLNNNAGVVQTEMEVGTTDILTVQYTNTNPVGVLILFFTNNQLTTKSQSGLNPNTFPINRAEFDQIAMGMSTAQVNSLVGNAGQLLAQTETLAQTGTLTQTIGYTGDTSIYATVQITYLQGEVISKLEVGL
jgi:hypothetical protein